MTTPEEGEHKIPLSHIFSLILRHGQCLLVYPAAFDKNRPSSIRSPCELGMQYIAPLLRTSDGVYLTCYLVPQTKTSLSNRRSSISTTGGSVNSSVRRRRREIQDARVEMTPAAAEAQATVIMFHGNAAHNWEDMESPEDFYKMGCNVFLASYRGYSLSNGTPSERGLRIDAQTALDYVLDDPYLSQTPIVIYGHSLGGAVSVDLASRNPSKISALILSNTFTSIPSIVSDWPILGPFSFLCTQRWNSASKIRRIPRETPILMLSGREDEVVPARLMDELWDGAKVRGRGRKARVREKGLGEKFAGCGAWCRGGTVDIEDEKGERIKEKEKEREIDASPVGDVFEKFPRGRHCDIPNFKAYWLAIGKFIEAVPRTTPSTDSGDVDVVARKKEDDVRWRYVDGELTIIQDGDGEDTDEP